jgi:hypothetical protein
VHSQNDYYVYENNNVLPKAWFVNQVVLAESPLEAFDLVLPGQGFDPSHTAIVESFDSIEAAEDPGAEIQILTYTARRMEFELSRTTPGFLVLSEIYYPPGWIARLNGEEIPIYKTNYLLRGFEIPAGEHHLELEFHPRSHMMGSRISWAANLIQWGIGLFLLTGWFKRRRPAGSDES